MWLDLAPHEVMLVNLAIACPLAVHVCVINPNVVASLFLY